MVVKINVQGEISQWSIIKNLFLVQRVVNKCKWVDPLVVNGRKRKRESECGSVLIKSGYQKRKSLIVLIRAVQRIN